MENYSDIIKREERGSELCLFIDLYRAQALVEKDVLMLSIPVERVGVYLPGLSVYDGYEELRNWYRKVFENVHELFAINISDIQSCLSAAPTHSKDAFDYLITGGEERRKHISWEWLNEGVLVEGWVFPAYALENANVPASFKYSNVSIKLKRGDAVVGEVCYGITPDKMIYYNEPKFSKNL